MLQYLKKHLQTPAVMGVLNITPDSFSDGGDYLDSGRAVARALEMIDEGAAVIDIGGESTRPGAAPVPAIEEITRVVPVIQALQGQISVPISIDTQKPEVMREAINAGASMINDVNAFRVPGAIEVAIDADVSVCLMHMQGMPERMQENPEYADVISEVIQFLHERADVCIQAGIKKSQIMLDPGFGFGKSLSHNLVLMRRLQDLTSGDYPILVGVSRKSMIGAILDEPDEKKRVNGGVVLATIALQKGASMIRTHDVAPVAQAIKLLCAVQES